MLSVKRYIISCALFLLVNHLPAQNLTGTWEGDLGNDQFLQLNIIQTGDKICGYTYDRIKANPKSFCKAFFEGRYDKQNKMLIIEGKYFLQNSGSHSLMKLNLNYKYVKGEEILEERPGIASIFPDFFRDFGGNGFFKIDPFPQQQTSSQFVNIKKVVDQPYELIELMKDCIARDRKKTDTTTKKSQTPTLIDSIPPVITIVIPEKPTNSLPSVLDTPVITKTDNQIAPKTISQRKNVEQSRIEVNVKTLNLKVYDNAIMDGDTVSILYNGRMLVTHQLLTEKGIELNIELDDKQTRHEITLFAENLGSIPPNTALVVITAGDKRYELFASASLEENAVLVFEYKPK
jgi:hypothetical protein